MQTSQQGDSSMLQDLLNKVPSGLFGGKDEAGKADELEANAAAAQMQNAQISPREPEEWTRMLENVQQQILPIIEWHDEIMMSITETIEKIPVLPALIEQLQGKKISALRVFMPSNCSRAIERLRLFIIGTICASNHQSSQDGAEHGFFRDYPKQQGQTINRVPRRLLYGPHSLHAVQRPFL